jgi:hypothetical protein
MSMVRKIHPRNCLIFVAKSEFLSRPLPHEASVALMENFQLGSVARLLEENGYAALTPGWPDDPETVEEAKAHPEVFAGKSIGQVADHFEAIIRGLDRKPAVIGHSFGGLLRPWPDTLDVALRAGGRIPASDPLRDDGPGLDIPPERGSPRGWPRMTRVRRFVMSADAGISLSNLARAAQWACPRAASIPSRIVSSPTANLSSDVA